MKLLAAILVGLLAYLGLHLGVLRKPLTIGYIKSAYEYKLDYARRLGSARKIVVIGGSSSLFGVRCQTIATETGIPCVNLAVTAGLGIDLILAKAEEAIRPGDIVLMPLEYDFYSSEAKVMRTNSTANTYMATYDRPLLARQELRRVMAALLVVSLQDAYSSVAEMGLGASGFQRRFTLAQLTPEGDMSGHSLALAGEYSGYVSTLAGIVPSEIGLASERDGGKLIAAFVDRHRQRGDHVYGTYPTTIDDGAPAPAFAEVEEFWRRIGAGFLATPGFSRYPRADFYDTAYHLAEPFQIAHSRILASLLAQAEAIPASRDRAAR